MSEFILTAPELDLGCNYHDCDRNSVKLFRGLSVNHARDAVHSYMATYCQTHATEHAADTDALTFVGDIEPTND